MLHCKKFHLSTVCVHTAPQHHYYGNNSMDCWRYCSPEEFVQFQDSSDRSEKLGHFQHQMYCYWCRDMQLSGGEQIEVCSAEHLSVMLIHTE